MPTGLWKEDGMLQIDHLYKNYGKFQAVKDLTLHIPQGDLFGFVGPNGAGKTTTIRMVCGLMLPSAGSIKINGMDALAHRKEIKKQIGYVPDFFGVYDNLKVKEYMDFYGSMYRMHSGEIEKVADDLLELVNLSDKKEVFVDTLSRGMKQRLCVARALIHNPALLVLDEPNSGLDPRARVEMKELLLNLRSMGKTIVISSHILSELSEMCNSIGIMDHGNLVAAGRIEDVMENVFGNNQLVITFEEGRETALRIASEYAGVKINSAGEHEIRLSHRMTRQEIAKMIGTMIAHDVVVTGFHKQEGNLETLFMRVTEGDAVTEGNAVTESDVGAESDAGAKGGTVTEGDAGRENNVDVKGGTVMDGNFGMAGNIVGEGRTAADASAAWKGGR